LHFTPVHQWVEIASLYLEGKAEVWFEGFLVGDHDLTIRRSLFDAFVTDLAAESMW